MPKKKLEELKSRKEGEEDKRPIYSTSGGLRRALEAKRRREEKTKRIKIQF